MAAISASKDRSGRDGSRGSQQKTKSISSLTLLRGDYRRGAPPDDPHHLASGETFDSSKIIRHLDDLDEMARRFDRMTNGFDVRRPAATERHEREEPHFLSHPEQFQH